MASNPKAPPTAKISDVIANFAPTRRFGPPPNAKPYCVTSIDFDDTGELALVAQDDETLQIYNCKEGKHAKELKSQKYGVDIARFAHHSQSIIYASTKGDDAIRYLSSHDNSYIRYFKGHTAAVTCIALNPASDEFLSSSLDNTVRLWDLRSANPQGQLNLTLPSLCAYDPTATVLAIGCPRAQNVLLYDVRNYDKAPFATFELREIEDAYFKNNPAVSPSAGSSSRTKGAEWTKLEFSNDGKKLFVGTAGPAHYVLDAFDGALISYCARHLGSTNRVTPPEYTELRKRQEQRAGRPGTNPGERTSSQGDVCLSPDGRYVIGGSGENGLFVWDLEGGESASSVTLEKVLRPSYDLSNKTAGTAAVVSYNPRHNLLVTADRSVVFWLPDMD